MHRCYLMGKLRAPAETATTLGRVLHAPGGKRCGCDPNSRLRRLGSRAAADIFPPPVSVSPIRLSWLRDLGTFPLHNVPPCWTTTRGGKPPGDLCATRSRPELLAEPALHTGSVSARLVGAIYQDVQTKALSDMKIQ